VSHKYYEYVECCFYEFGGFVVVESVTVSVASTFLGLYLGGTHFEYRPGYRLCQRHFFEFTWFAHDEISM
jgi:hypothetical protein